MKYQLTDAKLSGKPAFRVDGRGTTSTGTEAIIKGETSTNRPRAINRFVQTITDDIRDAIDEGKTVTITIDE